MPGHQSEARGEAFGRFNLFLPMPPLSIDPAAVLRLLCRNVSRADAVSVLVERALVNDAEHVYMILGPNGCEVVDDGVPLDNERLRETLALGASGPGDAHPGVLIAAYALGETLCVTSFDGDGAGVSAEVRFADLEYGATLVAHRLTPDAEDRARLERNVSGQHGTVIRVTGRADADR